MLEEQATSVTDFFHRHSDFPHLALPSNHLTFSLIYFGATPTLPAPRLRNYHGLRPITSSHTFMPWVPALPEE